MNDIEFQQRRDVVRIARTWIRTPFHDNASIKGVGVDCARLIKAVYEEAGLCGSFELDHYSPQWFLHRSEELFMGYVARHAHEIAEEDAGPGDIALFKIGRCYAHGAIIVDWPSAMIHAHKQSRMVIESGASDADLRKIERKVFSPWPLKPSGD